MYPGDPEAHPSNVYNCRCTIAARVIGFENKKANSHLTLTGNSDITNADDSMYRRNGNRGSFSSFPERMSKKNIRRLAKEAGELIPYDKTARSIIYGI